MTDLPEDDDLPAKGHNRVNVAGVDSDALRNIVDRVERVQCEIDELKDDQKEIFEEAKSKGLNVKIVRKVIRERRKRDEDRKAELEETENYMLALGML